MLTLAIETSGKCASVAVGRQGKILASSWQNSGYTHSQTLMPMIESTLKNCKLKFDEMERLAVACGPGSFTGIRIGISTILGLAFAKELPCVPVSTLEALYAQTAHFEKDYIICPVLDARREQVYNGLFRNGRLCPDRALAISRLCDQAKTENAPYLFVGDGAQMCYDYFTQQNTPCGIAPQHILLQNALGVLIAAEQAKPVAPQELKPIYLRQSQAERNLKP